MVMKPTPALRLVQHEPRLPSAFGALKDAADAEEAFHLLRSWSQSRAALNVPADRVEEELVQGGFEVLRRLLDENIAARGVGDVGRAVVRPTGRRRRDAARLQACTLARLRECLRDGGDQPAGLWGSWGSEHSSA